MVRHKQKQIASPYKNEKAIFAYANIAFYFNKPIYWYYFIETLSFAQLHTNPCRKCETTVVTFIKRFVHVGNRTLQTLAGNLLPFI